MSTYADEYKNIIRDFSYGMSANKDCFDLEELQAHLEEYPEIAYVAFPMTWHGYGTSYVMLANAEYLEKFHSADFVSIDTELFLRRELFFSETENSVELQELFFYVKNEYPAIDDEIVSRMEYTAIEEFLFSEIRYELELDFDQFIDALQAADIALHDWAQIDNDGYTVYAENEDMQALFSLLKEVI